MKGELFLFKQLPSELVNDTFPMVSTSLVCHLLPHLFNIVLNVGNNEGEINYASKLFSKVIMLSNLQVMRKFSKL